MRVEAEVIKVDPDAALARHRRRVRDRDVEIYPAIDGAADLAVRGVPADQAAEAYGYVDAIARTMKQAGDSRRIGQLRADIATSLLSGRTHIHNPDPHDAGNPHSLDAGDTKESCSCGVVDACSGDTDDRDDGDGGGAAGDSSEQACCGGGEGPRTTCTATSHSR